MDLVKAIVEAIRKGVEKGGPGSGSFGHAGRPGKVGGQAPHSSGGEVTQHKERGKFKRGTSKHSIDADWTEYIGPNGNSVTVIDDFEDNAVGVRVEGRTHAFHGKMRHTEASRFLSDKFDISHTFNPKPRR